MSTLISDQEEIQGKARIRVRSISDIGILIYVLYAAVLLFSLVILSDCKISDNRMAAEIHFCGIGLIDIQFNSDLIESITYHKRNLAWIAITYILLSALPGLLFMVYKRLYLYRVELSRDWLYISYVSPHGGSAKMTRIAIGQLESIVVRTELLFNGDTLIFRSAGNTVRIHCVTNAYDFARLTIHYHAKKTGNHNILHDRRRSDPESALHHESHEAHETHKNTQE